MGIDFREFDRKLPLIKRKIPETVRAVQQKVAIDVLSGMVLGSPVGNPSLWKFPAPPGYVGGQFRFNWQVTERVPANGPIVGTDEAGNATIAKGLGVIGGIGFYTTVWVVNALPYANRLRFGWSTQAPPRWPDAVVARVTARIR